VVAGAGLEYLSTKNRHIGLCHIYKNKKFLKGKGEKTTTAMLFLLFQGSF